MMFHVFQVRYVFDAVDDALNPHYEGLVRRYAGRWSASEQHGGSDVHKAMAVRERVNKKMREYYNMSYYILSLDMTT